MRRFFLIAGLAAAALNLNAQTQPVQVKLANLEQDVRLLQQQVGALRIDMESIQRENNQLRAALADKSNSQRSQYVTLTQINSILADLRSEINNSNAKQREVLITQVSSQVENLAEQTQKAIDSLAKSIENQPQAPQVVKFNDNFPKTGINYTVKSGDSLAKIARTQNSTVEWIRNANHLASDIIYPNQELFIPQKN